jgi:hypothetical protein
MRAKDKAAAVMADWVAADPLGPPPGWTGSDRDGAAFGTDTRRSPDQTCMGCMRASTGKDARLVAEIVRDAAQWEARLAREAAEKEAAGSFAQRKHGKAGMEDAS